MKAHKAQSTMSSSRHASLAFLFAVPISLLGGLMGLGGAEFRLPVLAGPLGYAARRAVQINLAISLVTVVSALIFRGQTLSLTAITPLMPALAGLIGGAVVAAYFGAALASHISETRLEKTIQILLFGIGLALVIEGLVAQEASGFLPKVAAWQVSAGLVFGVGIGLVSSLLGVAGGELIIPTLIFAYGAEIKTAGTASLIVSLPTVLIGVLRFARQDAFADTQAFTTTIAPMGVGSIIGAVLGSVLVGLVPATYLKVILGFILLISAYRMFRHQRSPS